MNTPRSPIRRRRLARSVSVLLVFAAGSACSVADAASDTCGQAGADAASATAQAALDALATVNGVPGMGAAVWRDGEVVWTGCTGFRDVELGEPVRRDTLFRIASVSKLFGATAAARLAQDGRLDLDAAIGEALPWLAAPWSSLTPRQLAAHISGAPHYSSEELATIGHVRYASSREAAAIFSQRSLLSSPGTAYRYSSWGYTLLGAVIEARSGRHFLDYLRDTLTAGLEITAETDDLGGRRSSLYDIEHGQVRRVAYTDMSYSLPGGGLAATPRALVQFGGRLLRDEVLSASAWSQMLQPTRFSNGEKVHDDGYDVAFGWRIGNDRDGARIAHHAGTTIGARSMLMLWPDEAVASALLSNASWIASMDRNAELLAAPFRKPPEGLVAAPCPAGRRYSGVLKRMAFAGAAAFGLDKGRCVGTLQAAGALSEHFRSAYQWPGTTLKIVALGADGGLSRAALVTPYGLYDLRAIGPGRWSARLGANTTIELRFP